MQIERLPCLHDVLLMLLAFFIYYKSVCSENEVTESVNVVYTQSLFFQHLSHEQSHKSLLAGIAGSWDFPEKCPTNTTNGL